ncbi:response regulator transcription factor [Paractinoplanes maris]|uniref:response regulator transcription factor n=1 Tax=Paractinoplanes maris TaxID=1734446 RepID=UPI0020228BA1|nr:response regulator transcription factor [Actinoplanes maris]
MAGVTPGRARPIRLLVVDDEPMIRTALRFMLGGRTDIEVVGEAGNGAEAITAVDAHWPDVVLMDVRMPRMDGVEATRLIRARPQAPQVIILTTFNVDDYVLEAIRGGATGFLLKDTPPEDLIAAVLRVASGESILSPQVVGAVVGFVAASGGRSRRVWAREQLGKLTDREREVAIGLGHGWSNAEIGAALGMGVSTVKGHVSRVLGKLAMNNRSQAAVLIHDAGLV